MEQKMVEKINSEIQKEAKRYEQAGYDELHYLRMAEINGMVYLLCCVTETLYSITENGLVKREAWCHE